MKKKAMCISVCAEVRNRIEDQAFRECRSLSSIIEELLMRHFAIPKKRPSTWNNEEEKAA
jgi:hypothetical protein